MRAIWQSTFCLLVACQLAQADDRATIATMRTAWDTRHKQIRSYRYDCRHKDDLVTTEVPNNEPVDSEPYQDESVPPIVVELQTKITFAKSGRKLAYNETGDDWNPHAKVRRIRDYKVAFNGIFNRRLSTSPGVPSGELDRSHEPNDSLTAGVNQTALWIWYSPVDYLRRQSYNLESMSVRNSQANHAGTPCIELLLERGENTPWQGSLYVDPKRDYVPLRFMQKYNEVTRTDLVIDYRRHDAVGYAVSSWQDKQFDYKGRPLHTRTAKVENAAINEPVDDALFAISFPAGTRVVERTPGGSRYFQQQDDGELKPISMEEFLNLSR